MALTTCAAVLRGYQSPMFYTLIDYATVLLPSQLDTFLVSSYPAMTLEFSLPIGVMTKVLPNMLPNQG
jgi:hypothetical protein